MDIEDFDVEIESNYYNNDYDDVDIQEEKEIKINIPDGYVIDKENSTFECIKFKPIEKKLPKTWVEFCKTHPKKKGGKLV